MRQWADDNDKEKWEYLKKNPTATTIDSLSTKNSTWIELGWNLSLRNDDRVTVRQTKA